MLSPPIGAIEVILENLDEVLLELDAHDMTSFAGVASVGEPAGYALVWEFGSARVASLGDRTCIGTTPDGRSVILSVQAPFGYIAINEPLYWKIIEEELQGIDFAQTNAADLAKEFDRVMFRVAEKIVPIIAEAAPKDSGALADSITAVEPNDPVLDEEGAFEGSTEGNVNTWTP